MTSLFFSGAEVAKHRNFLMGHGVETIALNLSAYLKQRQPIVMKDAYEGFRMVLYSSEGGLDSMVVDQFIKANEAQFEMIYDLRCDSLFYVPEWTGTTPNSFYDAAALTPRIGVAESVALDPNLMRFVTAYAHKNATELTTTSSKAEVLKYPWANVISGAWLAASKHRELQVWDGKHVARYNRSNRQDAVEKHWAQIENLGCDPQACIDDDTDALMALAVRSWLQFADRSASIVAIDGFRVVPGMVDEQGNGVAIEPVELIRRPQVTIPVMSRDVVAAADDNSDPTMGPLRVSASTMRVCSSCNVSALCPEFVPNNSCAFDVPIRIENSIQLDTAEASLLEMQYQRVAFARLEEDLLGQGINPNTSAEIERFGRMAKTMKEGRMVTEQVTITAKASGGGLISQMFGAEAGKANRRIAATRDPEMIDSPVFDAEEVEPEG